MEEREEPVDAALGPLVPPELVPALIHPAKGRPANPFAVAAVVVGVVLAVTGAVLGVRALYAATLLRTALAAVEAAAADDIRGLRPLLPAQTVATPAFTAALKSASPAKPLRFTARDVPGGVGADIAGAGAPASFTIVPAWGSIGEAVLTWKGPPFGSGTGRVVLDLEQDGWKVWAITVGKKGASFAPEDAKTTFGGG